MQTSLGSTRPDPYKDYTLSLSDGVNTYFGSKLTGLISPTEVVRHRSGGDPSTPIKSPGRVKYESITLNRGVAADGSFSAWAGQIATVLSSTGVIDYRNGDAGGLSPRKLTGQDKFGEITLNRGIVQDQSLSNWVNGVRSDGSNPGSEGSLGSFRRDIILQFYNEAGKSVVRYQISPRRIIEFRGGSQGVFYHALFSGGARRRCEQLAGIFESSLDAQKTSGPAIAGGS
ncbi:MAG TPA: phage tail protein [Bryobacteraceae bacterium]|nr:phage tail protein [Bryobacteraceae bacterium]